MTISPPLDRALGPVPTWAEPVIVGAGAACGDIAAALALAVEVGRSLPPPGAGRTAERWRVLAGLARADVTVARVVEAHTDALAIIGESGADAAASAARTWGVFAAEGGDDPLVAQHRADSWVLSGHKPWCSLGGVLDSALVTARSGEGERRLFEVDLAGAGVSPRPAGGWVSRGLRDVVSVGIDFDAVPARPVGAPGWYLRRPGFAWGGAGVAACWFGAAVGVADRVSSRADDAVLDLHGGRIDLLLHAAGCVLSDAARGVGGRPDGPEPALLAHRVRAVVADACEGVLREVGHACGPGPLTSDARHAARVADLEIYLRQHHGERDVAALGRLLPEDGE